MSYDESRLRIERFDTQINHHAAYTFWSLEGVLAERWAHGPVFGGSRREKDQVLLVPPVSPGSDNRLWAVYGLRGAALNAEGPKWVPRARDLVTDWYSDVLQAFDPKRVVQITVDVFALYPVDDAVTTSQRLRAAYYSDGKLKSLLPDDLHERRDDFHAAIDFIVPLDENQSSVSVVVGTVGPMHKGTFFNIADEERDSAWWLGIRYERKRVDPEGHRDVVGRITKMAKMSVSDTEQIARRVFNEVLG
jgi:hypothetical protein